MTDPEYAETVIVNYHYCQPAENGTFSGVKGVRPDVFKRQMLSLRTRFRPIGLDELADGAEARGAGSAGGRAAALVTFDDGTHDVYEHALPILAAHGMTAVLFCCSAPLLEGRVLDVQKIHFLQARLGMERFRTRFLEALDTVAPDVALDDPACLGLEQMYRYDEDETRRFKFLLNVRVPYDTLGRVLDALFEAEFGDQREAARHIYMSADDVLRARDRGFVIGLHTHSHRMLSRLDREGQDREIGVCAEFYADLLGEQPTSLSYPYGIHGTYTDVTKDVQRRHSILRGFTLGRRSYDPSEVSDPYEIPRFDVNDVFGASQLTDADGR